MAEWIRFFCIRLPLAALCVALAVEGIAALLDNVTPHRHNVDDLASAVTHDTRPYRTVLLGDSVTHNVSTEYRIGDVDEVADLTTHMLAGLPSAYFLLRRYVESGHHPQHVVLAISRRFLTAPIDKGTFEYYITSVFRAPYERQLLQEQYPDYVNYKWRPAALSMTTRIGEPFFSLLRHPSDQIWTSPATPSANPGLEHLQNYSEDEAVFAKFLSEPTAIRPEARALLSALCQLSKRHHFALHIVWAPVSPRLRDALRERGITQKINNELAEIFRENDTEVTIDDSSDGHDYPYFDHNLIHIRGLGWEQAYANELTAYIHRFEAGSAPRAPIAGQSKP